MNAGKAFFDTNVLLYLLSGDSAKADKAEELIAGGRVISVQVLNEFASVATPRLGISWVEIHEILSQVRAVCPVEPITVEVHDRGLKIAERYSFSVYDATSCTKFGAKESTCDARSNTLSLKKGGCCSRLND